MSPHVAWGSTFHCCEKNIGGNPLKERKAYFEMIAEVSIPGHLTLSLWAPEK
jgi:hypothetical protein